VKIFFYHIFLNPSSSVNSVVRYLP